MPANEAPIILATINARYIHAALGLRYLLANMGELQPRTRIMEFVLGQRPIDIVERILDTQPAIVGLGVYIWNAAESAEVVALLKTLRPDLPVVLGGPEVSHECDEQDIVRRADYVIAGHGDVSFPELCRNLLAGSPPPEKIIPGRQAPLTQIELPYHLYSDEDIARRFIYVEASRGCPFKCEFCLSALDKTSWPFDLPRFLDAMDALHRRGVRHFKFVDRTFNLNVKTGLALLEFFLERMDERLFLHFEVVPDHLPDALRAAILRFPPGRLQFEVGIQTFNPDVQALISRKQDNAKAQANLDWLVRESHVHLHVDLIAGLPGEDMASFGSGFDKLVGLGVEEIQVGVLKRLRGAPIARHAETWGMRYSPLPPYNLLATSLIPFADMQRMVRFARYWDLVGNSGRFPRGRKLLLGAPAPDNSPSDTPVAAPFNNFMRFSDWLWRTTALTSQINLERLFDLVFRALTEEFGHDPDSVREALALDYAESGARGAPKFLADTAPAQARDERNRSPSPAQPARQARHARSVAS